ncbi:MAG TPA: pyroglutamyl-peptidase I [Xanthobacteraceae bacterium]|jgi:pyroglutamyl-peptidase
MLKVLLTGFGPFPGAPFNPTASLVTLLASRRGARLPGVRVVAHVFSTSYAAVDRELPTLLAQENPAVILMFGVAGSTRHLRIETFARNARSRRIEDAIGYLPTESVIEPNGPSLLRLRSPVAPLLAAARAAGIAAAVSHDAGDYLCNYLCWRASRIAEGPCRPRLVAFVHVPPVRPVLLPSTRLHRPATLGDLVFAGESILLAAITAAGIRSRVR